MFSFYMFYFIQTNATATLKKFVPHCCSVIEHLTSGKLLNSPEVLCTRRYSAQGDILPMHMKKKKERDILLTYLNNCQMDSSACKL